MELDVNPIDIVKTQIEGFITGLIEIAPNAIAALLFLLVIWVFRKGILKLFMKATTRSHMRESLQVALRTVIGTIIWTFGILIAITILLPDLTPTKLLAGLGIGTVAIGLAFKDIFENFMAGIMVLVREPMRLGDYIEVEDISGQVKEITLRDTYVRQTDGELVLIPNAMLFKNPVHILTDWDERRVTIICGVAYDEDVAESREVIRKAVQGVESVIDAKPIQIFAQSFNSSSIDFEVTWWTKSKPVDIRTSRDQVIEAVKKALDEAGIEIPYPYRTLTFKEPLQLQKNEAVA